jgi:hypothetical protein
MERTPVEAVVFHPQCGWNVIKAKYQVIGVR